jgi:hypothetical protein
MKIVLDDLFPRSEVLCPFRVAMRLHWGRQKWWESAGHKFSQYKWAILVNVLNLGSGLVIFLNTED